VLTRLRGWRTHLPQEIWYEEIISLSPGSQTLLPQPEEVKHAYDFFSGLKRRLGAGESISGLASWFRDLEQRLPEHVWGDELLKPSLHTLWANTHQGETNAAPPPGYQPPTMAQSRAQAIAHYQLFQRGGQLNIVRGALSQVATDELPAGSWLGQLASRSGELVVEAQDSFWLGGSPPVWASHWGEDDYGAWIEFKLETAPNTVTQRMRWISPGCFLMGSPESEVDRDDDEGPQHQVTLTDGYWLFDTAVSQALWQAVMEENPSQFQGAEHPVENVSWHDCQRFISKLSEMKSGLELSLPTEAQWEYACRAGSQTPFSFGAQVTTDLANYDGNFPYNNGEQGEYRQETVAVKNFPPNKWGLYQMHGNVYEWCQDGMRAYRDHAERDPVGPEKGDRVLRGGSWIYGARDLRAAYRGHDDPEYCSDYIGFRCARVQAGAKPVEPLRQRSGMHSSATSRKSEAQRVVFSQTQRYVLPAWPQRQNYVICSELGAIALRQLTQPEWASAMGRDRFGMWVEIEVESEYGAASQRLRWIPPGRFMMGSPERERGSLAQEDDEKAWFSQEGPQHRVTLSQGYWLFDTPVTQVLWQAVMGKNPSKYQSPQRPVESVSWHDANGFIARINEKVPALNLTLSSEAQWEYACRASSETATYAGNLEILGNNNAPMLDDIAWYGGNSGHGYELAQGSDSSDWPEKQYEHSRAGTRDVAQKRPNGWGLYDMLGNVWEWCRDGQRTYQDQAEQDPVELEGSEDRVLRGGSWFGDARTLRAAYRSHDAPEIRYGSIGFRCARVQERGTELRDGQGSVAERRPDSGETERK